MKMIAVFGATEGYQRCRVDSFSAGSIIATATLVFDISSLVSESLLLNETHTHLDSNGGTITANGRVVTIKKSTVSISGKYSKIKWMSK